MFFIEDDQAEVGLGRKKRAARSDHDIHLAVFYFLPFIELFA